MSETRQCNICDRSIAKLETTFTVMGSKELCGTCRWWYVRLLEALADEINQRGELPTDAKPLETNHE